jgi:hypothetical protein
MLEHSAQIALAVPCATAYCSSNCQTNVAGVRMANCFSACRSSIDDLQISVSRDSRLATCVIVLSTAFEELSTRRSTSVVLG